MVDLEIMVGDSNGGNSNGGGGYGVVMKAVENDGKGSDGDS